jgi:hypothetical protein
MRGLPDYAKNVVGTGSSATRYSLGPTDSHAKHDLATTPSPKSFHTVFRFIKTQLGQLFAVDAL